MRQEEETVDVAVELVEQLARFHGCEAHHHEQANQDHDAATSRHVALEDIVLTCRSLPDTLGSDTMLPQGRVSHGEAESWKHLFLGTSPEYPHESKHVCLHCSRRQAPLLHPNIMFDIDSVMGFADSLAVAKQGIRFNLTPQVVSNLAADVHLTLWVSDGGRGHRVPLYTVPHYLLGQPVGQEDIMIFLFFPKLYEKRRDNNYLSQAVLERWTDRVLLPAIYGQEPASTLQHYPTSFRHGKLNSKAAPNRVAHTYG